MNARILSSNLGAAGLLAVGALLYVGGANAATDSARAKYEADRAHCMSGQSHQDRQTCLREAGAALQEAQRNRLVRGVDEAQLQANAAQRCERVPPAQREGCMALRDSQAVRVQGSVEGGGILRQRTLRQVGEPVELPPSAAPGGVLPDGYVPVPAGSAR